MTVEVDIKKAFGEFTLDVKFEACAETLGFLGASGSGKSLTLRCIAGLERPDKGRIVVGDRVFFDSDSCVNLSPQKRKTALLFQNFMLFPNLTVAENIKAGLPRDTGKQEMRAIVAEQLSRFGLVGFGHRYPQSLSGGQQQRVALARMLAAKPDILMLDEPFSALDAHLKSSLEQDLLELFDEFKGSILYISHDIDEAFRFCDRIAVVDDGKIKQLATASEILGSPSNLATLKVSGVKNITPVHPLGESAPTMVEAPEWGMTAEAGMLLDCGKKVPADVRWLGVRAIYLRSVSEQSGLKNVFKMKVRRTVDSRFERTVILDPGGIVWRLSLNLDSDRKLPNSGDVLTIQIPPEHIYLVAS